MDKKQGKFITVVILGAIAGNVGGSFTTHAMESVENKNPIINPANSGYIVAGPSNISAGNRDGIMKKERGTSDPGGLLNSTRRWLSNLIPNPHRKSARFNEQPQIKEFTRGLYAPEEEVQTKFKNPTSESENKYEYENKSNSIENIPGISTMKKNQIEILTRDEIEKMVPHFSSEQLKALNSGQALHLYRNDTSGHPNFDVFSSLSPDGQKIIKDKVRTLSKNSYNKYKNIRAENIKKREYDNSPQGQKEMQEAEAEMNKVIGDRFKKRMMENNSGNNDK